MLTDKKARARNRYVTIGLLCIAAGALAVLAYTLFDYVKVTHTGAKTPPASVATGHQAVSETKPAVTDTYSVPAGQPRTLEIPAIKVKANIQRIGITKDGDMATPTNIYFAGWYVNGAVPGAEGNAIIDGHVSGKYADGVFKHLAELKPADNLRIQMGDLTYRTFAVRSVHTYPLADTSAHLYGSETGEDTELTLITCGGAYNGKTREYDERTIVKAVLTK